MTSSRNTQRSPYAIGVFLLLFAIAFFRVPFFFPVAPSVSASYVYQFNNRVATLIFIAGVAAFAIWSRGMGLKPSEKDSRVSAGVCALVVVAGLVLSSFFIWIVWPFGLHGEADYAFSRIAQLASGKLPYRDFEFAYGPLLLYPPLWISKLFHVSLISGYFTWWMFNWALGICILRWIINAIEMPSPYRRAIFLIFSFGFAVPLWAFGLNYAPMRAMVSGGLAVFVFRTFQRGFRSHVAAAIVVLCAAVDTAVSPEHGLAFMAGTGLYVCISAWSERRFWSVFYWIVPGFGAIVALSAKLGVYTTLRAFSSGAYNFPIMPTQDVLCVLALYVVAACAAYHAWRSGERRTALVYLLCVSMCGLPTCFGRADSGHMQLGAFPAVVTGALFLGRYRRFSLVFALVFVYYVYSDYARAQFGDIRAEVKRRIFDPEKGSPELRSLVAGVAHRLHKDRAIARTDALAAYVSDLHARTIPPRLPNGIVDAPLGITTNGVADMTGKIDYGYFFGQENAVMPYQIASIIRWLAAHPERDLVLPVGAERDCYHYSDGENRSFSSVYGVRWATPRRRMEIFQPLCEYIVTHYSPEGSGYDEGRASLWRPLVPAASGSYAAR